VYPPPGVANPSRASQLLGLKKKRCGGTDDRGPQIRLPRIQDYRAHPAPDATPMTPSARPLPIYPPNPLLHGALFPVPAPIFRRCKWQSIAGATGRHEPFGPADVWLFFCLWRIPTRPITQSCVPTATMHFCARISGCGEKSSMHVAGSLVCAATPDSGEEAGRPASIL
jgi:hypothetical protein